VSAVANALGVSRQHLSSAKRKAPARRRGRPPLPEEDLVARIQALIAELPTYGYRRIHALLRRQARNGGPSAPNAKRVYRVMKVHGLLLRRHSGKADERRHDGRVAVDTRNTRWCSDGFEIGCDNGEKVRVAFSLDCCDREAMGFVATTAGISAEDVRDLMTATVEHRFGRVNRLPATIEWLTDNGSCYTAKETRRFAREINLRPRTTPIESPQSNGMAEAFVRTMKRDYVRVADKPNARAVLNQLPSWFQHYNTVHPHRALALLPATAASQVATARRCQPIIRSLSRHKHRNGRSTVGVYWSGGESSSQYGGYFFKALTAASPIARLAKVDPGRSSTSCPTGSLAGVASSIEGVAAAKGSAISVKAAILPSSLAMVRRSFSTSSSCVFAFSRAASSSASISSFIRSASAFSC